MRKPAQEGRRRSTFARLVFSILAAIAMLATGGIVAAVHAPVAQAATGPDGASAPYVYWNVVDTDGNPVAGATFTLQTYQQYGWTHWGSNKSITDCTASGCTDYDRDADGGDFLVKWIDRKAPGAAPGQNVAQIDPNGRYGLTPQNPPAGYEWVTGTDLVDSNSKSWVSNTLNFGTFKVQKTNNAPKCDPGYIYGLLGQGQIIYADPSDGYKVKNLGKSANDSNFNGLGIGTGGSPVYAYKRNIQQQGNSNAEVGPPTIYQFNTSSGTWNSTSAKPTTNTDNVGWVAEAVDLDTGHYFLGGYVGTQQNLVFRLWEYTPGNPGSVTYKGSVATPNENVTGADNDHLANGDMAFDANGNLFIVQGVGTTTTIYSVTSNTLDNASGGDIASSSSKPVPNTSSRINGTAFDFNGQGYLGNGTNLDSYDMPGWSNEGTSRDLGTAVSGINASTDLASCSSPPTISIQKNVQDARVNAADQFKLTLNRQGTSNSLAEATTKGNNPGIQPDQIGPLPVRRGTQLTFAEAASGMPNLNNYDSTWACTVDGDQLEDANGNDVKGTGTSGSLTFPTDGQDVTCIFTNTPKPGNATWQKQDSSTKAPLDGSEWTLTGGPNWATVPANTVVSDCTSSPCAAGLYKDQDSAAGKFQLNGLPIGSYTLVEKTAPTGYELNTLPYNFTVTANGTVTVTGSPFLNTKLPVATVTISKTVQDVNGQNGKPATGWSMNTILAAGNPAGVAITPAGAQTTAGSTGVTPPWTVTYPSASSQASATVSETQQTGYQFVSGSCMVTPTTGSVRTVNLTGATENLISGINPGENVACSFVNKQKPGSVSWSKSDTGGDLLDGSEWTLTPTDPAGAAISVTDNTGQSGYSGLDTNTDAGKFTVGALKWGKYELQETKAPAGYVLSGTKYPFEIKATGLTAKVNGGDAIKNEQATPPNLPLTGGMSTDAFLIGGSLLIIVSAGVWLALRRRSRAEA